MRRRTTRGSRVWARVGIWVMQGCAVMASQWGISYDAQFWCDWRTDVRFRGLDRELIGLTASSRADHALERRNSRR